MNTLHSFYTIPNYAQLYIMKNIALLFGLLLFCLLSFCFFSKDFINPLIDKLYGNDKDSIFFETSYSAKDSIDVSTIKRNDEAWNAYKTILSGDFSLIEDESYRNHLEATYEYSLKDGGGKCIWRYILMDFNNDGLNELFVQYQPDPYNNQNKDFESASDWFCSGYESGLFYYKDGKVICWDSDTVEANYYWVPLKNGKFLDVALQLPAPYQSINHMDSEFKLITEKAYFSIVIDYKYHGKDFYEWIFKEYNLPEKEGIYYFFQDYKNDSMNGKRVSLSKAQWQQIEKMIDKLLIPESEWNYCSDLNVDR